VNIALVVTALSAYTEERAKALTLFVKGLLSVIEFPLPIVAEFVVGVVPFVV
jgi:hypothetical protein